MGMKTQQNFWNTIKVVLIGTFIILFAYIKIRKNTNKLLNVVTQVFRKGITNLAQIQ